MFANCLLKTGKEVFLTRLSKDHSVQRQAAPEPVIFRFVPAEWEQHDTSFNLGAPLQFEDPEGDQVVRTIGLPCNRPPKDQFPRVSTAQDPLAKRVLAERPAAFFLTA